jgi:rod shape-determining protein MreC
VFPRGYPVAEVMRVDRNAAATFALVDARPTARLDRNREVLLVWFTPPVAQPEGPLEPAEDATGATAAAPAVAGPAAEQPQ